MYWSYAFAKVTVKYFSVIGCKPTLGMAGHTRFLTLIKKLKSQTAVVWKYPTV
jgi:hypothetical protein